jgi:pyruvate/2-oxoacid:ferredoxin oxidoreductase alpha subunit
MTEKRHKKLETFIENEFNQNFYGFKIFNENANKFFITMGINSLTIKKFIEENPSY